MALLGTSHPIHQLWETHSRTHSRTPYVHRPRTIPGTHMYTVPGPSQGPIYTVFYAWVGPWQYPPVYPPGYTPGTPLPLHPPVLHPTVASLQGPQRLGLSVKTAVSGLRTYRYARWSVLPCPASLPGMALTDLSAVHNVPTFLIDL